MGQAHLIYNGGGGTADKFLSSASLNGAVLELSLNDNTLLTADLASISTSTYIHTQADPSNSWVIEHSLGKYPSVTVLNSAKEVLLADVTYIDSNSLVISFSTSEVGYAFLN